MTLLLAIVIGCLYAGGVYMMLRRSLFKLILGLVLLSHGANLLIFTAGGLTRARPPINVAPRSASHHDAERRATMVEGRRTADPLPQALILTAIVIGFGVLAFALVLFHEAYRASGSDDPDELRTGDQ
jgi:multicomponent Na+:H+ antiporter subunit C